MTTKMGRPPAKNPKSNRITVRLDNETLELLEEYCRDKQIEKTEALRIGIRNLIKTLDISCVQDYNCAMLGGEKMKPRRGRPPKTGQTRDKKMNIRLSGRELQRIEKCAEQLSLTRTDTLLAGLVLLEADIEKCQQNK